MDEGTGKSPVFVIGDVHGHLDRLEALIEKAGVKELDCTVVQLGDLSHVGGETRQNDLETWLRASQGLVDVVLWGNHDRAAVDSTHLFGGYADPDPLLKGIMNQMEREGRLKMAIAAHGWLLTHAGLHAQFKYQPVDIDKEDSEAIAEWLNERAVSGDTEPVIDAVGRSRGGWSQYGGVLWRDINEKLYDKVPQVFGHSASREHAIRGKADSWWCIDIGGKGGPEDPEADQLAGIWLPSQELVRVHLHKE